LRPLTPNERSMLRRLSALGVDIVALSPTETGLKKHIMDAVIPLRDMLYSKGFHDYARQPQGVIRRVEGGRLTAEGHLVPIRVSLYRPFTKHGDPRIWFQRAPEWSKAGDMLGIFLLGGILHVVNLSTFSPSTAAFQQLFHRLQPDSAGNEEGV